MRIELNITQEEALKRLSESINTDYSPVRLMYGFGWSLDEIMYGKIEGNEFWLYDRAAFSTMEVNPCTRQLTGKISTENGETIVDYDLKYTKYNFLLFAIVYVVGVFLTSLSANTVDLVGFVGFTVSWLIAVSLTMSLGILFGKKFKERAISHFLDVFSDCISENLY